MVRYESPIRDTTEITSLQKTLRYPLFGGSTVIILPLLPYIIRYNNDTLYNNGTLIMIRYNGISDKGISDKGKPQK